MARIGPYAVVVDVEAESSAFSVFGD